MRKITGLFISLTLSVSILASSGVMSYAAEGTESNNNLHTGISSNTQFSEYDLYIKNSAITNLADNSYSVSLENYVSAGANIEFNANENAIYWTDGKGSVSWNFSVEETALYNMEMVWKPLGSGVNLSFGLLIDGMYYFDGMESITINRLWKNASEQPRKDVFGNEYAQEQTEIDGYRSSIVKDHTGVVIDSYTFPLSSGNHTVALVEAGQGIAINQINFVAPEKVLKYEEISNNYEFDDLDVEIITLQGENADIKTSNSLIPKSNNSDSGMTPHSAVYSKINYIGGTSWQSPGSSLIWKFNVEKSGYYYINFRYKQSDLVNGNSLRTVKIDGKTPFEEAKKVSFAYDASWKYQTFSDSEENPYYIWMDEGEHTITLEATLCDQSEYFSRLSKIVDVLGDEYIKIVMITSETPDLNRDYELFNQIPGFTESLTNSRDGLLELASDMKAASGKNSTQAIAAMENMARVLNNMLRNPFIAQQYISDYYTNYTSVSAWLYDMTNMPLSLDEMQIVPYGKQYVDKSSNIFQKIIYSITRLIISFTEEYAIDNETENETGESVRLWVNWGQDQSAVLNSLIEDSFTSQKGIPVKLEIVNASLINGILAGNFPDVALHMSRTEPVNLGMRGALADLTQFEDYEEVLSRFQEGAETPYRYKDALYALPDTQGFFMMFYRTDIFENLELSVPKTWDEFLYAATIIQRNNMSVYVPYTQITSSTTVNAGIGNLNLLPTLLGQNNLSLYNKELTATDLTSAKTVEVFNYWTDFYTKFNFYKEADFYNRFRVGIMPLGIASYATYTTLYSAAPEIQGRWSIAMVPGTESEDGTINNTIAGGGTGCTIIEKSKNKQAAWEFLKWWTSASTQSRYNNNVESLIGMIGRTSTANVEALSSYTWESDDLEVILSQWSCVEELPEVPGSYYLSRAIDQAFWSVINGDTKTKDAIVKWSMVADEEIARKIKEYS